MSYANTPEDDSSCCGGRCVLASLLADQIDETDPGLDPVGELLPPEPPRYQVRYGPHYVTQYRQLSGDHRFPLRPAPKATPAVGSTNGASGDNRE